MAKRIDPDQRREQIIEAAFRLVVAQGIGGVSLRKVADESGVNIGSVRHYFGSHEDLLKAAATEAGKRMGARLAEHPAQRLRGLRGEAAVVALAALVETVLPIDEAHAAEAIVVMELVTASRTMPVFREMAQQMGQDLFDVLVDALSELEVADAISAARQLEALIGGLTMDTLTPHGAHGASPAEMRAILRAHLGLILAAQPQS
ncbi:MAG: TetR/AcrR family transcriptional regulator [Ancrocorticia sp.]|uniref:TetR/AcrR family transcriptional regulator n=1 Tax=Ancrocorticia sp. TaxID=2593684 RepID=UPI003F932C15